MLENKDPSDERKRILVVEDDPQMSKFIQFKLNYLGYEVVGEASNGEDALDRASLLRPDLILMDIMLEGDDDGIETARKIMARQHLPIVYLTAHEDEALFERAKITEPFGYLIKPFNDRDLRIVMETSLYHHQQAKLIKKSLQNVRNMLDSSADLIIACDAAGHILDFNRRAAQALGLKKGQARDRTIRDFLHDGAIQNTVLAGDPQSVHDLKQARLTDQWGNPFAVDLVVSPLKDDTGAVTGRLLVARLF